jgi:DnaJ-class molecular chaperone
MNVDVYVCPTCDGRGSVCEYDRYGNAEAYTCEACGGVGGQEPDDQPEDEDEDDA